MKLQNINYATRLLLPALLFTLLILLTKSTLFAEHASTLSLTITLDLLFTIPLVYFLVIRKTNISKTSVFLIAAIGLYVSSQVIPKEHQSLLPLFKIFLLPVVEIVFTIYLIISFRKARHNYKLNKSLTPDFYTTIKGIARDVLPRFIATALATEVATVYYGLFYWKKRILKDGEFSLHKKSSSVSLFLSIMLILGVEAMVVHSMIGRENTNVWIVTLLSMYSLLQILGFLKSLIKRPITFNGDEIQLRYGIMKETTIKLSNIGSIELSSKNTIKDKKLPRLSLFGNLESHNVIIHLKEKETLHGLYGFKRNYKVIAFYVDEPQAFFDKTCTMVETLKKIK